MIKYRNNIIQEIQRFNKRTEIYCPVGGRSIVAHEVYGDEFFKEATKYNPDSPYSASKAGSDHFVCAFHETRINPKNIRF